MRVDGHAIFYIVQHWGHPAGGAREDWVDADPGFMLFDGVPPTEASVRTFRWRKLIERQGASTDLWQRFGINGFVDLYDARLLFRELRQHRPSKKFRIVRRQIVQLTELVT